MGLSYFTLMRNPVPFVLWLGQVASTAGDKLYTMAMLWMALQLTGSAEAMGMTAIAETVTLTVVGLFTGALVDRVNKLRLTVAVDGMRAFVVLLIPAADSFGHLRLGVLVATGTLMGALNGVFRPAFESFLPRLVPAEEFHSLAGLMDTPARFAQLFGSGSAGALLAVIPVAGFFLLDAASFGVSIMTLLFVAWHLQPVHRESMVAPTPRRRLTADVVAGIRIVLGNSRLLLLTIVDFVGNFAFVAYTLGGLILATREFHIGLGGYGGLIAAYGVGSLVGNVFSGNVSMRSWRYILSICGWLGIGVGFLVMGWFHSFILALGALMIAGLCGAVAHVSRVTYLADQIPRGDLGKVYSMQNIFATLAGTAGTLVCGRLLDTWSASHVIRSAGLLLIAVETVAITLLIGKSIAKNVFLKAPTAS